jgi:hypothetical protein
VIKYPFFSWMGLLATVLLILLLNKLSKTYQKYMRKWCKIDRLENDIVDKFKQFKETQDVVLGHQYNNLRIRSMCINVLLLIAGMIVYVLPLFIVYTKIIDLGNYLIWFVCFFVLNITIGVIISRFDRA